MTRQILAYRLDPAVVRPLQWCSYTAQTKITIGVAAMSPARFLCSLRKSRDCSPNRGSKRASF